MPDVVRLTAVSPEGARSELLERMFRFPRPDVAEFFSLDEASWRRSWGSSASSSSTRRACAPEGWLLEIEDGQRLRARARTSDRVTTDVREVQNAILNDPHIEGLPDEELMAKHTFPALSRIQSRGRRPSRTSTP